MSDNKDIETLEKVADKLSDNVVSDIKKLLKGIIPNWFELRIKQGLRPVAQIEDRLDRVEQEQRAQGKDIEMLRLLQEQINEKMSDLNDKLDLLPNTVKDTTKEQTQALAKEVEKMNGKKPRFLNKLINKLGRKKK